jgi:cell division transport system permease protein
MFTPTYRIIKFSIQDFFRNFWLSFVTLTILVLALFSINLLIIFNVVAGFAVSSIENKIDINIYFKPEINEDQVHNVQRYLQSLIKVKEVNYISKDQALANFKERHKDNPKILQSIEEINQNPLGASLIVKAKSPADYPAIMENLADPQYNNLIESKDFDDHKQVIGRITGITQKVNTGVIIVALIFTLISILIISNAIKMAIYTHREEIIAMKLVGATNWFIRGPFLFQSLIFAVLSVLLTIVIVYPLLGLIQPYLTLILENDFSIIAYFNNNFVLIFGLELLGAMILNFLSSYWSVNKYLDV